MEKLGIKKEEDKQKKVQENISFKKQDFTIMRQVEDKAGKIVEVEDLKPEFRNHFGKCKMRACEFYNVSLNHLSKAVEILNGRKIDGFYVNDLVGRYGFYDGKQINRADLASKNKTTPFAIDLAQEKLKKILQSGKVESSYVDYINMIQKEADLKLKEMVAQGE